MPSKITLSAPLTIAYSMATAPELYPALIPTLLLNRVALYWRSLLLLKLTLCAGMSMLSALSHHQRWSPANMTSQNRAFCHVVLTATQGRCQQSSISSVVSDGPLPRMTTGPLNRFTPHSRPDCREPLNTRAPIPYQAESQPGYKSPRCAIYAYWQSALSDNVK